ncbi:MAG: ABC transporter ATP-binding protein [Candidatus Aminicenantales bacterium]
MNTSASPIQAERLVKSFGRVEAVRGVSFCVRSQTITAFLGENGAGKTTTLRLLLGFLRPDSGSVSLGATRVGYVPEQPAFFPWIKGEGIVRATAGKYGIPPSVVGERLEELTGRLGFDPGLLVRIVNTYSAGNRKKLSYLQSLLVSPDLLVVDEPFSALDPQSIRAVRELLLEMRAAGQTIFLSSHLLSELERVCDDFIVIRKGRIVAQDNLPKLRDGHVFVRLERSLQEKWGSLPLPYPRRVRGRFIDWLVPRRRLESIDRVLLDKAEIRPLDLERLFLFLAD